MRQLTAANAITRLADLPYAGAVAANVPAQSVTLFVLPAGVAPPPSPSPATERSELLRLVSVAALCSATWSGVIFLPCAGELF